MRYHVVITDSALLDIELIAQYLNEFESDRRSIHVVKALLKCIDTLERYPKSRSSLSPTAVVGSTC